MLRCFESYISLENLPTNVHAPQIRELESRQMGSSGQTFCSISLFRAESGCGSCEQPTEFFFAQKDDAWFLLLKKIHHLHSLHHPRVLRHPQKKHHRMYKRTCDMFSLRYLEDPIRSSSGIPRHIRWPGWSVEDFRLQ